MHTKKQAPSPKTKQLLFTTKSSCSMTDLDEVGLTLYNFGYPFPALKARLFV